MTPELAVIIPYCGEFPHLHWTIQSLLIELEGAVEFEIVLVDNSPKTGNIPLLVDGSKGIPFEILPNVRKLEYPDKLSHWSCKNLAVRSTEAPFLFFIDAHCLVHPGSLREMFLYYKEHYAAMDGSIHLPIADFFKEQHAKVYRLLYEPSEGVLHYENQFFAPEQFAQFCMSAPLAMPKQTPCMSTCGMLCRREHISQDIGYWPDELGAYGGGENYYNFTMALMGRKIHLFPVKPLRHWHIPGQWSREYSVTYPQWARNILIATYLVGGTEWLQRLKPGSASLPKFHPMRHLKPEDEDIARIKQEILTSDGLFMRRAMIQAKSITTIEKWAKQWMW